MKKNILLGLSGSVACSKSEKLFNTYKEKFNFKIIGTNSSTRYLSKEFLNSNKVVTNWDDLGGSPHIDLARWADIFLIYPATANLLAKLAVGIADDLLTSTYLMFDKPTFIAPAMHEEMYLNVKTIKNIKELNKTNIICGPRYGNLDIGDKGYGRMLEPEEIFSIINKDKGSVIVTSGGTHENIDDVKVISNLSSGKQGRAIAFELLARGYDVTYIHADTIESIPHANNIRFTSSNELFIKLKENIRNIDTLIMTAAVSDFTVNKLDGKVKRDKGSLSLELQPNLDIVKTLKKEFPNKKYIAFSAQTNNELNFDKLNDKNVDYLVINNILENKFGGENNKIQIIDKDKLIFESELVSKEVIASHIIDNIDM